MRDIGIDLGTANVVVSVDGKTVRFREPTVLAVERNTKRILCFGEKAQKMIGRTPQNILAVKPLHDGVISHYDYTLQFLQRIIKKVSGGSLGLSRPRVSICIPGGITEVEVKAILDASTQAGARRTYLIEKSVAAAIGSGKDISQPNGIMVVDIGAGTTDTAVISSGGIIVSDSIKTAGDKLDEAIIKYMRFRHDIHIGERTAEEMKRTIGTVSPETFKHRSQVYRVKGRSSTTGLPTVVNVTPDEMKDALYEPINQILDSIQAVAEKTPIELINSDIPLNGIMLTGGGSLLHGLDRVITDVIGIRATVVRNPMDCVALGTARVFSSLDRFSVSDPYVSRRR